MQQAPVLSQAERRRANRRLGWLLAGLSASFAIGFVVKIVSFAG